MNERDSKHHSPTLKTESRSQSLDARVNEITRSSVRRSVDEITRKAEQHFERS